MSISDATGEFERVETTDVDVDVAFQGRLIASPDLPPYEGLPISVYLTPKGRIVVDEDNGDALVIYDDYDHFIAEWADVDDAHQPVIAQVACALGKKYVRELDI